MKKETDNVKKVAVLVDSVRTYTRGLILGISQFAHEQSNWSLYFPPQTTNSLPTEWLQNWDGNGILVRIENPKVLKVVRECNLPTVDFCRTVDANDIPVIAPHNRVVAEMAFEHFHSRGFQNYGYYGITKHPSRTMKHRASDFATICKEHGMQHFTFPYQSTRLYPDVKSWEQEYEFLAQWLQELPKPIGIMTCNDHYGMRLLEAARRAEIAIPDEVAVVGVGNDECLCQLSTPPLSSVILNSESTGYKGAKLLNDMMSEGLKCNKDIQIKPTGIVTRVSSDILAFSDSRVTKAIQFIRKNACNAIGVTDVMRHVHMSRTGLNSLLRKSINRSAHEEIRRARLERVKEMLLTTDAPIKEIAYRTGFNYTEYLVRTFRKATGKTPLEFRKQALVGDPQAKH